MTLSPQWTWAPNNLWALAAQPDTSAISFDVERGLLVLITPAGPPPPPPVDVPVQVQGGKGPVLRPQFDHILDMRPGELGDRVRQIRDIGETLRRTSRGERELVEA